MTDALKRIKELDEERASLLDSAKKDALTKAKSAIADLNALGFAYQLAEGGRPKVGRKGTRTIKDSPCPVCKFKTSPPHDARRHRGQKTKKPFTVGELKEM